MDALVELRLLNAEKSTELTPFSSKPGELACEQYHTQRSSPANTVAHLALGDSGKAAFAIALDEDFCTERSEA